MTPIRPIFGPHPDAQLIVHSIQDATAPEMLWGKREKAKKSKEQKPLYLRTQFVYLFQCSFDAQIVIGGISCDLKTRAAGKGYGQLLWSRQLPSRNSCSAAERRFMRMTQQFALGPEYRGRLTWTEARRMNAQDAIKAWEQATARFNRTSVPLITQSDCAARGVRH